MMDEETVARLLVMPTAERGPGVRLSPEVETLTLAITLMTVSLRVQPVQPLAPVTTCYHHRLGPGLTGNAEHMPYHKILEPDILGQFHSYLVACHCVQTFLRNKVAA